MLIVCPNCATSYQVDPSSLGAAGRSVRCVRCKQTWFAANPAAMAAIARTHKQEVAAFASRTSVSDFAGSTAAADAVTTPMAPPPPDPGEMPTEPPTAFGHEFARDHPRPEPFPEPSAQREPPTIEHAPSLAPDDQTGTANVATDSEDIESVAARRFRREAARRRSRWPGWTTAILALIAINTGLIAWRTDIVRFLPQTATLYSAIGLPVNLRGVVFTDIVTRKETQDGVQMLVVEGIIKSTSKRSAEVPRLRFAVRNIAGQEIYSWTAMPARHVLPPGDIMPFRSRLASPPPEAHAVLVRFFHRRDLVGGLQ